MRIFILASCLALLLPPPALADEAAEVKAMTKERIGFVIGILKDTSVSKQERNAKIIAAVEPIFNFAQMAKLSLGKKHWKGLSKAQRKEFVEVFSQRLRESYLEKLDLYTDEEVAVEDAKRVKKRIHVTTQLITKDDKKEMVYKFYKSKKGWKVYDVVILGVSVVQTYRSQFNGFLQKDSVENLLAKLRITGEFAIPTDSKK